MNRLFAVQFRNTNTICFINLSYSYVVVPNKFFAGKKESARHLILIGTPFVKDNVIFGATGLWYEMTSRGCWMSLSSKRFSISNTRLRFCLFLVVAPTWSNLALRTFAGDLVTCRLIWKTCDVYKCFHTVLLNWSKKLLKMTLGNLKKMTLWLKRSTLRELYDCPCNNQ